jgi:hypothetical protein
MRPSDVTWYERGLGWNDLRDVGPNDSLKVRWQNDADTGNCQCESSEEDRIADFDLKLMQIESEHMEIPEQHYKVIAKLPSAELQKICRVLKKFGETTQVSASKEGIRFKDVNFDCSEKSLQVQSMDSFAWCLKNKRARNGEWPLICLCHCILP